MIGRHAIDKDTDHCATSRAALRIWASLDAPHGTERSASSLPPGPHRSPFPTSRQTPMPWFGRRAADIPLSRPSSRASSMCATRLLEAQDDNARRPPPSLEHFDGSQRNDDPTSDLMYLERFTSQIHIRQ